MPGRTSAGTYSRDNLSDPRIHYAQRNVTALYADQLEADGQKIYIQVMDESGRAEEYLLKVFFQSDKTDVEVRMVNTATGAAGEGGNEKNSLHYTRSQKAERSL